MGLSDLGVTHRVGYTLSMVSPDAALRTAGQATALKIEEFLVENVSNNVALYNAFKAYATHNADSEDLTAEQRYFIQETMKDFKRNGLDLPEDKRKQVVQLQKELAKLTQEFDKNIAEDNRTITVTADGLVGLEKDFIATLKRDDAGGYILGIDTPTYVNVIENCSVAETRKQLFFAIGNRAYPVNGALLKDIIAKRDELATVLGFASYAALNLDSNMVVNVERAQTFLDEVIERVRDKENQEFELLTHSLPEGICLTDEGKLDPWHTGYVKALYKKNNFSIDEREIAEYFPMEKTVEALLDVYRKFLNIEF